MGARDCRVGLEVSPGSKAICAIGGSRVSVSSCAPSYIQLWLKIAQPLKYPEFIQNRIAAPHPTVDVFPLFFFFFLGKRNRATKLRSPTLANFGYKSEFL